MLVEKGVHVNDLKELFYIDEDWQLLWKVKKAARVKIGDIAGGKDKYGYQIVSVNYRLFKCHRIIWALFYGEWPSGSIDHINGVKDDNRIENLRVVTHQENLRNQKKRKTNKTGVHGISRQRALSKWQVFITVDYKNIYLGVYEDFFEAVCARKSAELQYGFHVNHGRS